VGPTVIEAPPQSLCVVDDFWFRYVADMGIAGRDRGKGSNDPFVPPGYGGDIPDGYFTYQCPTFTNWVVLRALGGVPAMKQTRIFHTAPPFLTYSELGGLPQDPHCGAESCPRSQEVAEGGLPSAGFVVDLPGFPGPRTDGGTRGTDSCGDLARRGGCVHCHCAAG
jgi:hypothetical protein